MLIFFFLCWSIYLYTLSLNSHLVWELERFPQFWCLSIFVYSKSFHEILTLINYRLHMWHRPYFSMFIYLSILFFTYYFFVQISINVDLYLFVSISVVHLSSSLFVHPLLSLLIYLLLHLFISSLINFSVYLLINI